MKIIIIRGKGGALNNNNNNVGTAFVWGENNNNNIKRASLESPRERPVDFAWVIMSLYWKKGPPFLY